MCLPSNPSIHSVLTSRILVPGAMASRKKSSCETATTKSVLSNTDQRYRRATSSPSEAAWASWKPSSWTTRRGCSLSRVWTRQRQSTGNLSHCHHETPVPMNQLELSSSTGNIRSRSRRTSGNATVLSRRPTRKNWTSSMKH